MYYFTSRFIATLLRLITISARESAVNILDEQAEKAKLVCE